MKKSAKSKAPKVDPYVEGLMGKLLERLVGLERKMDVMLSRIGTLQTGGQKPQQSQPAPQPPQNRHDRTLYEAICADCAKVCEVPFKPSEQRPVYCKTCYAKRKGGPAPGMPILRPVSLPPKTKSTLGSAPPPAPAPQPVKKSKKPAPAKKKKGKK